MLTNVIYTRNRMANSTLKCQIIILITARSFNSYDKILINFGQLYSNNCIQLSVLQLWTRV